jgi:CCR4-NOT transcription complex subunit 6
MPTPSTNDALTMLSATSNSGLQYYSWHLSLRVDRPVEGCAMRPHAYMYSKKLDERDLDKPLPSHSKKMREPPPNHEFVYRWFRGPPEEPCAYEGCPRRNSFSPHDWSLHALGMRHGVSPHTVKQPAACRLQCVSTQSSLYMCTFCNSKCFVQAWKTQYTIPKSSLTNGGNGNTFERANSAGSNASYMLTSNIISSSSNNTNNNSSNSRSTTPTPYGAHHLRSPSFDDTASVGSQGSAGPSMMARSPQPPGTPRAGYNSYYDASSAAAAAAAAGVIQEEEWLEVSRDQIFMPGPDDIGRRLKLEAAAYSHDSGERLMYRVVKTDLVLARAPDPLTRPLVVVTGNNNNGAKPGGTITTTTSQTTAATLALSSPSYGARFRVVTYNVLAEIYATQQQYPYCDFWALSWDYR